MRISTLLIAAITAAAPTVALAQTAPGQGQYQGNGYRHTTGPTHDTGQPGADCEDLVADNMGATPGHSATAPGGGSPFSGEDSTGGSHYAGSQPQNSRNTQSVSQYDVACENQTPSG
jgi:hypothetical protein